MRADYKGVEEAKEYQYSNSLKPGQVVTIAEGVQIARPRRDCVCIEKPIRKFIYDFLKTYLFALHEKVLSHEKIELLHLSVMASACQPAVISPSIFSSDENGLTLIHHDIVYAYLMFENVEYQVTVFRVIENSGRCIDPVHFTLSALAYGSDSTRTDRMIDLLISESIRNSYYKNKVLSVVFDDSQIALRSVEKAEFQSEELDNLFVPANTRAELAKFVHCVERFQIMNRHLRYLMSGEPGTGKTKSVRSLINACKGKATILIAKGEINFTLLFEFAAHFRPAVLCFDDLDLSVGTRDHSFSPSSLSAFLQELDGFEKNNIFVLATTNDKNLVDRAASRPGRFDMILDFGRLDKGNYLDLIRSVKPKTEVMDIFDGDFIELLRKKKVTGAFIVNLVKQLEIRHYLEPRADLRDYVKDYFELSHRGFYKNLEERENAFGFIDVMRV
ncbi:AAA family ATPase [bacterium]|nr:AAA family ATPase [bacterium]